MYIPKTDNITIGKRLVFKGSIRLRDFGSINERMTNAKAPIPKRQTVTSIPDTPDNLTKNSELACPHIPKKAEKYAITIINLFWNKNESKIFSYNSKFKNVD